MINIGIHTNFKTKNFAKDFLNLKIENDIKLFLDKLSSSKDFFVFGGGTNILFSKPIYESLLFVKNSQRGIKYLGDSLFEINAGENLTYFVSYLNKNHKIDNLNTFYGLPGTIGGAIIGNAGSFGIEIGNFVKKIKYIDENGNIIETENYNHKYRYSNLKGKKLLLLSVILDASVTFGKELKEGSWYMNRRLEKQDHIKTTGSFFKNTPLLLKELELNENKYKNLIEELKDFENLKIEKKIITEDGRLKIASGWIIEKTGLKGYDIGGVQVSPRHANFFLNYNNDDPQKIIDLSNIVKDKVYNKYGIVLEEETIIV